MKMQLGLSEEDKAFLQKEACFLRSIYSAFRLDKISLNEFFFRAKMEGAIDSEYLIHHDKMAELLTHLKGKKVTFVGSFSQDAWRAKNLYDTSKFFKSFKYLETEDGKKTHCLFVNRKDDVLFDSEEQSVLRAKADKVSYRVYSIAA